MAIDVSDWTLFLFLFVFGVPLVIALDEDDAYFLTLSGIAGLFLGLEVFSRTSNVALSILVIGIAVLILATALREIAEGLG